MVGVTEEKLTSNVVGAALYSSAMTQREDNHSQWKINSNDYYYLFVPVNQERNQHTHTIIYACKFNMLHKPSLLNSHSTHTHTSGYFAEHQILNFACSVREKGRQSPGGGGWFHFNCQQSGGTVFIVQSLPVAKCSYKPHCDTVGDLGSAGKNRLLTRPTVKIKNT